MATSRLFKAVFKSLRSAAELKIGFLPLASTSVSYTHLILKGKTIKSSTLDLPDVYKRQVLAKNKNNWDLVGALRVELSKLRAHYYLLETFEERVKSLSPASDLYPHLANLLQLYYVSVILIPFAADFIRFGVISSDLVYYATSEYFGTLCGAVRPYVVGLTDSFQQPDNFLNSAIGKYDGNIYENYFGVVKSAHPPRNDKAPYNSALTGMLNRPSQEERERFEKSAEAAKILSR